MSDHKTCGESMEEGRKAGESCAHCDEESGGCPVAWALGSCERYDFRPQDHGEGYGGGDQNVTGDRRLYDDRGVPLLDGIEGDRGSYDYRPSPGSMGAHGSGLGDTIMGMGARDGSGDSNDGPEDDPRWLAAHDLALAGDLAQLPPGLRDACLDRLDDDARAVAQDYARAHGLRTLAAVGVPRG